MPSWRRSSHHLKRAHAFAVFTAIVSILSSRSYFLVANCAYFQNRANLTLNNTRGQLLEQLPLSAVFTSSSAYQQAYGPAVYVSSLDNFGCSKYVNSNLPPNFVAIVSLNSICSVDDQIQIAYESGAQALIVRNNISDTPTLSTRIQERPIVSVLVSNTTGDLVISLAKTGNTFVLIVPNYQDSQADFNYNAMGTTASHELSPGAIAFIVLGTVAIILIISGMWIIFYLVQRARRVEERERYAEIMERLTKKAIAKTKCRKLKMGDKELVGNEVCIICMDNFKINDVIRRLPCSHYFHKSEIDTWLFANQSCPICKENLLKVFELDVQTSSGFFRRILERFHLVPTPVEIHEVILAQSESRRGTAHSRRDTVFSVSTSAYVGESLYSGTRRNTFFGEHPVDFHPHPVPNGDTFNEAEENELEQQAAVNHGNGRRLTFFGEKEEDLNAPPTDQLGKPTSNQGATDDAIENAAVSVDVRNPSADGAAAISDKSLTEIPL